MEPALITTLILLVVTANGAPVVAALLLGRRWDRPLDNSLQFFDQRPLLGASKTFRGIAASIAATALMATLLGLAWYEGAWFALLAMLGDLCSSFIKRRLGFPSGRSVVLLDQLPESILPVWVMQPLLGASMMEMLAAVAAFSVVDLLLSRALQQKIQR